MEQRGTITGARTVAISTGCRNYIFVLLGTDDGLTGVREASLGGQIQAVLGAAKGLDPLLLDTAWARQDNRKRIRSGLAGNAGDIMARRIEEAAPEVYDERRLPMTYEQWLAWAGASTQSEWVDGEAIIFMPPKTVHALLATFLTSLLSLYVELHGLGRVIAAPFEMRLSRSAREPDILFVATANLDKLTAERFPGAADLVIELISDDSVGRDRVANAPSTRRPASPSTGSSTPDRGSNGPTSSSSARTATTTPRRSTRTAASTPAPCPASGSTPPGSGKIRRRPRSR